MSTGTMPASPAPGARAAPKAPDIRVLRCLNSECRGLLAYEVDSNNVLYIDLAWTATVADGKRYFPCPKCGGKNILEEVRSDTGRVKHRVARWEPAAPVGGSVTRQPPTAGLELMPRTVRDKLDHVGLKLHLKDWQALSLAERQQLCDAPCDSVEERRAYGTLVDQLVRRVTGKPADRLPAARQPDGRP